VPFLCPPLGDQLLGGLCLALQPGQPRFLVHPGHLLPSGQPAAHDDDDLAVGGRPLPQRPGRHPLSGLGPGPGRRQVAYSTDLDDATRVIERVARELRARLKVAFDRAGIEVSAQKALTADSQGQPAA
jgi:hypothetical protein